MCIFTDTYIADYECYYVRTYLDLDAPRDDTRGNTKKRQIEKKSSQAVIGTQ